MMVLLTYIYYHGIIDHSGINFKAYWWQPWQPHCIFHDNHHQYFHVNFGFNIEYWDKVFKLVATIRLAVLNTWFDYLRHLNQLHGTYRKKDRLYREDIYYGQGKALAEATANELDDDIAERQSENPLAYDNNQHAFQLTKEDVKKIK